MAFISPKDSPNGTSLLAVANEVSGTTTLFEITSAPQQQFNILFTGSGDRLLAGAGKDILFAGKGGSILTGGDGRDQFWIGYNGLL